MSFITKNKDKTTTKIMSSVVYNVIIILHIFEEYNGLENTWFVHGKNKHGFFSFESGF